MSVPAATWPRFRLFDEPSPLASVPRFSTALGHGVEVWVKREDLLPLAFGGNKLRNLEFLVGAALAEGADTLVTSGRRWSNHCRLTAAAGAKAGLGVELVLSGPALDPPGPGVRLMTALGATVHQLATADRAAREAEVDRVAAAIRARGRAAVRDRRRGIRGRRCLRPVPGGSRAVRPGRGGRPGRRRHRRSVGDRRDPGRADRRGRRPLTGDPGRRRGRGATGVGAAAGDRVDACAASDRPSAADADLDRRGRHRARRGPAGGRLRPPDGGRGRGDPAAGTDRGHPDRPDLHGQGPGRPRRHGRAAAPGTGSASCSGTPAACRACSNRSTDRRRPDRHSPADRHASRSFIRPAVWRTAPA